MADFGIFGSAVLFYRISYKMMAVIAHYYLGVDKEQAYIVYAIAGMVFFLIKNICYFLHKEKPLPREWYYKILYICALQILPMLAVWKFVFL